MGISFGRIGTFVGQKMEERKRQVEEEKRERREIEEARKKAVHEERIRSAPSLAKQQVAMENKMRLSDIKAGKSSGLNLGGLRDIASGIGQSGTTAFQSDFNAMFGSAPKGKKGSSGGGFGLGGNAFEDEFNTMFGGSPKHRSTPKHRPTPKHKSTPKHKPTKSRGTTIIIR